MKTFFQKLADWWNNTRVPVFGFIVRYWVILLTLSLAIAAIFYKPFFKHLGPMIYLPAFILAVHVIVLVVNHIVHNQTSDEDLRSGRYLKAWESLEGEALVRWTVIQRVGYIIGASIIAAALIK